MAYRKSFRRGRKSFRKKGRTKRLNKVYMSRGGIRL